MMLKKNWTDQHTFFYSSNDDGALQSISGVTNAISNQDPKQQQQEGEVKRAAARLIGQYYFMLTNGCGNSLCENPNCVSSGKVTTSTCVMYVFKDVL